MQRDVEQALEMINRLLQRDDSSLTLVEIKGDTLTVRFEKGTAGACEDCVIDEGAIEMLVREAILSHVPAIRTVQITTS